MAFYSTHSRNKTNFDGLATPAHLFSKVHSEPVIAQIIRGIAMTCDMAPCPRRAPRGSGMSSSLGLFCSTVSFQKVIFLPKIIFGDSFVFTFGFFFARLATFPTCPLPPPLPRTLCAAELGGRADGRGGAGFVRPRRGGAGREVPSGGPGAAHRLVAGSEKEALPSWNCPPNVPCNGEQQGSRCPARAVVSGGGWRCGCLAVD